MLDERWLQLVIVKYKTGIQCFTLDGAMVLAHCACGLDNCVLLQIEVDLRAFIDKLEADWVLDRDEGGWDLLRADKPLTDVSRDEQQLHFSHISELG